MIVSIGTVSDVQCWCTDHRLALTVCLVEHRLHRHGSQWNTDYTDTVSSGALTTPTVFSVKHRLHCHRCHRHADFTGIDFTENTEVRDTDRTDIGVLWYTEPLHLSKYTSVNQKLSVIPVFQWTPMSVRSVSRTSMTLSTSMNTDWTVQCSQWSRCQWNRRVGDIDDNVVGASLKILSM